ncbi:MAG: tRNA dihydrouridine synthase DusB [Pseudomonadota bacterium]|nr:tRNA dihydrouridine synthase DusB [Pseudomonadota bacterium]
MPIRIGSIELESPVILAPMSGVSDLPFRKLVKGWGGGLVISEMIASQAMVNANQKTLKMITNCAEEQPMAVQLAGYEPGLMAEAAKMNEDRGASIIDINMGCPVKKIVNKHSGSALMRDLVHARKIIEATVKAVEIPVTLKMRKGWDEDSLNAPELAKIAENEGIQLITVHGRTRCQMYTGTADWRFIRRVTEAVSLPVVANGDIRNYDDVSEALAQSGAAGVMIGRGATGRPWFLAQVAHYLKTGERLPDPSCAIKAAVVRRHFEDILDHFGSYTGLRIARKHLGWYSRGYDFSSEFRHNINKLEDVSLVKNAISAFFDGDWAPEAT